MSFPESIQNINNNLSDLLSTTPEKYKSQLQTMNWILTTIAKDINIDDEETKPNNNIIVVEKDNNDNCMKNAETLLCRINSQSVRGGIINILNERLNHYGIKKQHLSELRKCGGGITGSFVLACIMKFLGKPFRPNDIDILIPVKKSDANQYNFYDNSFVNMLINDLFLSKESISSYNFASGIEYTSIYSNGEYKYNFVYISENIYKFIADFDLSCCINFYDGDSLLVFNEDDLYGMRSSYNINRIPIDKLYRHQSKPYISDIPIKPISSNISFDNMVGRRSLFVHTKLYAKYRVFRDVNSRDIHYSRDNNLNNVYPYFDKESNKWLSLNSYEQCDEKIKELNSMGHYFPIHHVLSQIDRIKAIASNNVLIQQELDVMNMIRCYERIMKYIQRGISFYTEFDY